MNEDNQLQVEAALKRSVQGSHPAENLVRGFQNKTCSDLRHRRRDTDAGRLARRGRRSQGGG